jgi:hypothetical protein
VPCSRLKERENPREDLILRRKEVTTVGKSKTDCYRCGTKGHLSHNCLTPKHLVDLYQHSKNKGKGQHESHLTTKSEAQPKKHDDMTVGASGGVRMDKSEDNLLDGFDIFGDL